MKLSEISRNVKTVAEEFNSLNTKTKLMAAGTVLLVALSAGMACFSFADRMTGEGVAPAGIASEEAGLIAGDMEPIPLATPKTQLATGLMELMSNEDCVWIAEDDELCAMDFTEEGFTEYNGDIETTCTVEFYEIAAIENGREGVWRVHYPDGSAKDARFTFTEDLEAGQYVVSSWAFPTHATYRCKALSGSSMLE